LLSRPASRTGNERSDILKFLKAKPFFASISSTYLAGESTLLRNTNSCAIHS
jgi:hypothetical protein